MDLVEEILPQHVVTFDRVIPAAGDENKCSATPHTDQRRNHDDPSHDESSLFALSVDPTRANRLHGGQESPGPLALYVQTSSPGGTEVQG